MSWRPSRDQSVPPTTPKEGMFFWETIQTYYDLAVPIFPLPRNEWDTLQNDYILDRVGKPTSDSEECKTMRAQLPTELRNIPLGHTELDVLGLILNYDLDRALTLEGPRGAGKSTLLHYIEAAVRYSGYKSYPIFLILDGNSLDEERGPDDYASLLADELVAQSKTLSSDIRAIFDKAYTSINANPTVTGIRESLRFLADGMGPSDKRRIVIVFDNLDHLTIRNVRGALELAKRIYVHAGTACIACVRRRYLEGVYRRGDARNLFNLHVVVTAPKVDVWIRSLGQRIKRVAEKRVKENRQAIYAYGNDIEPHRLGAALELFVELLTPRRKQKDDIIGVLQAASADDMRHLGQLVRRMLAHHLLPGRFLLGLADPSDYHPLRGLLEGYDLIFQGDKYVPNLLCFDSIDSKPEFLISQRVLRLLGDGLQRPTESLIHWMDILGYDRDTTVGCLQMLHEALVIRGTDSEVLDLDTLPISVYLTESGALYRDHLLANPDYLLSSVLDVPLEHAALRGALEKQKSGDWKDPEFSALLDSLREYTEEVIGLELAQLRTLTTIEPSPGLRRVVDVLQRDGLFASSLFKALTSLTERSRYTKASKVMEASSNLETLLPSLADSIARAYNHLTELANRSRRRTRQPPAASRVQLACAPITVRVETGGDDLEITASVRFDNPTSSVFVAVSGKVGHRQIRRATIATANRSNFTRCFAAGTRSLSAKFIEPYGGLEGRAEIDKGQAVEVEYDYEHTALMVPEYRSQKLVLKLYGCGGPELIERHIGGNDDVDNLKTSVQEIINEINEKSSAIGKGRLSIVDMHIRGTALAKHILNDEGSNVIASIAGLTDTIVVFSTDLDFVVPWEWIRPSPRPGEVDPPMLCESCRVVRWPAEPLKGVHKLRNSRKATRIGNLCTIGLDAHIERPSRVETPLDPSVLANLCEQYDTIHLIGHFDEESGRDELVIGKDEGRQLRLTCRSIDAHPFARPNNNVIVSACKVGSLTNKRNIALTMAAASTCITWTPLVSILESDAEALDGRLVDYAQKNPNQNLDSFFAEERRRGAFGNLYVRYGL